MNESTEEQLRELYDYWLKLSPELKESVRDFIRKGKSKEYLEGTIDTTKHILASPDPGLATSQCLIAALLALNYKDLNLLDEKYYIN